MENKLIKSYGVSEFAMLYFPHQTPTAAYKTMRRWINLAPGLKERLAEAGYRQFNKYYTPKQVRILIDHFGEP